MAETSKIEWLQWAGRQGASWNPVRGCKETGPECVNCYARVFAERFRGVEGHPFEYGFDFRLVPHLLTKPIQWTRQRMIFVNSMSDLFYEQVPDDYIKTVARAMQLTNWHIHLVLTKRSERMRDMLKGPLQHVAKLPHIWWGVSAGNREKGLPRVDHLRDTPAKTKWVSFEPLLEDLRTVNLGKIKWAVVGGESGANARSVKEEWVQTLLLQCRDHDIPYFFKQWGGKNKKKTGRVLNNKTYDEYPPRERIPVPSRADRAVMIEEIQELSRQWTSDVISEYPPGRKAYQLRHQGKAPKKQEHFQVIT